MRAFVGVEVIGVLADETKRPRESLPEGYRRTISRIIPLFLLAALALGLSVSPNDPLLNLPLSDGPIRNYPGGFIIMAERAGIGGLGGFVNFLMIIAIFSAATADVYFAASHIGISRF